MKYWVYFGIIIIFGLYLYLLLSPSSFPSLFNNLSSIIFHIYFITFLFPRVISFPMMISFFSSFMQTHTPTHPFFFSCYTVLIYSPAGLELARSVLFFLKSMPTVTLHHTWPALCGCRENVVTRFLFSLLVICSFYLEAIRSSVFCSFSQMSLITD